MSTRKHRLPFALFLLVFFIHISVSNTQIVREINNTTNVTVEEIRTNGGQTMSIITTVEETHIEDTMGAQIFGNKYKTSSTNNKSSNKTSSSESAKKELRRLVDLDFGVYTDTETDVNIRDIDKETSEKNFEQIRASCVVNGDAIQNLKLQNWPPFNVRCIADVNGKCPWAVILERKTPSDNFDFRWQQYRNGFGNPATGNGYFVGLQNLHALTQYRKQELYISKRFESEDLVKELYANFHIGDESIDYAVLNLRMVNNNTMVRHLKIASKFSTKDRQWDNRFAACVRNLGMGWWYSENCLQSTTLRSVWAYVKAPTIMAVRPNNCE